MLENSTPVVLDEFGTVVVARGWIEVRGFTADNASCRDLAALSLLWAIGELQRELNQLLERPGGSGCVVVADRD